jgi:hypothetical protein
MAAAVLRSLTPTFLEAAFRVLGSYQVAVRPLAEALRATGSKRLLDLGSGGAGPLPQLLDGLAQHEGLHVQATLTDKFPNLAALAGAVQRDPERLSFLSESIDATQVPSQQTGLRTMFQLLHHFPPPLARAILQDAVDKQQGIAIFEVTQRRHPWDCAGPADSAAGVAADAVCATAVGVAAAPDVSFPAGAAADCLGRGGFDPAQLHPRRADRPDREPARTELCVDPRQRAPPFDRGDLADWPPSTVLGSA